MSEVHFCNECNNMTYIHLDEENNLIHACKSCGKIEKIEDDMNCIYIERNQFLLGIFL